MRSWLRDINSHIRVQRWNKRVLAHSSTTSLVSTYYDSRPKGEMLITSSQTPGELDLDEVSNDANNEVRRNIAWILKAIWDNPAHRQALKDETK